MELEIVKSDFPRMITIDYSWESTEPCFRDEFGYLHRFHPDDIKFICENGWKHTPGYYMTIRDLLLAGF